MTMMGAKAFVDTNILLRALMPELMQHAEAESLLQKMWSEDRELWISRQVIREFLVQSTHPNNFNVPPTLEEVLQKITHIESLFKIADDTNEITKSLIEVLKVYPSRAKQIHDANIVATMFVHEIDTLLTFNVKDFQRFEAKITIISQP